MICLCRTRHEPTRRSPTRLDGHRAGGGRVKRMVYPVGFRWSVDMKRAVGTDLCMHAHVGFWESGQIYV